MLRHPILIAGLLLAAAASTESIDVPATDAADVSNSIIDLPAPDGSEQFGTEVLVLENGNYVVSDPMYGTVGAVYLYDGRNNAVISTLTGSSLNDRIASEGVKEVGGSNFLVASPGWDNGATIDAGALTWVDGTAGLNGVVSASNSLIGTSTNDYVGVSASVLQDGSYVALSPDWGSPVDVGAATWGDGNLGVTGAVDVSNSIVGSHQDDLDRARVIGLDNGNAVLALSEWDNGTAVNAGAVTLIDRRVGSAGVVSATNSLVGVKPDDRIGSFTKTLTTGHFVVASPGFDNGSLVDAGSATWGSGLSGVVGPVSAANSLIGQSAGDAVGANVHALTNGNYVVTASGWRNGVLPSAGAVTWGDGHTGTSGTVSAANSIHGVAANDAVFSVTVLANGNYVVSSNSLDVDGMQDAGGAMWADGAAPTSGAMSSENSIVGNSANDQVGETTRLRNGNFVVRSKWQTGGRAVGAATFARGDGPSAFAVSSANSLVGSTSDDLSDSSVIALTNGNYLVGSPSWDSGTKKDVGAVTWASGTTGIVGQISAANSLVGATSNDRVGIGLSALKNGRALIASPTWDNGAVADAGVARVISGEEPTIGGFDETNGLVGSHALDRVGRSFGLLADDSVLIVSPSWDNGSIADAGAITFLGTDGGLVGVVSEANSLVGKIAGDSIGSTDVNGLDDRVYLVRSNDVDNGANSNAGAITYATSATVGPISNQNTVFGAAANGATALRSPARHTSLGAIVVGLPADNRVALIIPPDTTPPTISTPADVTVLAGPGATSAAVDYPLPAAHDLRSTPTVACAPPPGSSFPIGVTMVACTATDAAGLTATATFTVRVNKFGDDDGDGEPDSDDYVPLDPARLADTRVGGQTVDGADAGVGLREVGSTLELLVAGRGGVAADASAVILNVTAVEAVASGFATVWPCGELRPTASNLNFAIGSTVPNAVIAKVGSSGKVCLYASQPLHFVVDVNGYAPATSTYEPLNPARVLDTRADGVTVDGVGHGAGAVTADSTTTVEVSGRGGVPADATSVVLNLTATESAADGFVTAYPCGAERPNASSVNGVAGATVANLVISKIGADGSICVFSQSTTHLIADINGYFTADSSYVPVVPTRLMDSRPGHATVDSQFAGFGQLGLGTVTRVQVTGRGEVPDASTVVLNVTVTEPVAPGYITAYPCGLEAPLASNLNFTGDQTVANGAVVKVGSDGTVCLFTSQPTQLVIDVAGYFP